MTPPVARTRPLVAVLSRVPLFVEALKAAFGGIADVATVSAEDDVAGPLVRAYQPDAAIVEGSGAESIDESIPCVHVDLACAQISIRRDGTWVACDVELSAEAIRNVTVAALFGGEGA
jgi:hypothetical protein